MPSKIVNENDLRVKRTKHHLTSALMELLKTNSIGKITVSMICNEAMVNRATFYKHYDDKYQLLKSIIYSLKGSLIGNVLNSNIADPKQKYSLLIDNMLKNMQNNKKLLISLLRNSNNNEIYGIFLGAIKDAIKDLVANENNINIDAPLDSIVEFYSGGIGALLISWILEDKYTEQEMRHIILQLALQTYK